MTKFNKWMEYIFTGIFVLYILSCMLTSTGFDWAYGGTLTVLMAVYNLHNEQMEKLAEIEGSLFSLNKGDGNEKD